MSAEYIELDCFTETLLRKEYKSLVNHLMDDPAPADWIIDLVVSRCKEIQAQLRTIKN